MKGQKNYYIKPAYRQRMAKEIQLLAWISLGIYKDREASLGEMTSMLKSDDIRLTQIGVLSIAADFFGVPISELIILK